VAQFANQSTYSVDFSNVLAGPPSYTLVGDIVNIDISGPTTDLLDATAHDDEWRERVDGLKDAGTLTVTVRFRTDTHVSLLDNIGTLCAHKIEFPKVTGPTGDAFAIESDGYITTVGVNAPHDGLFEATVSVQLTGEPDITEEVGVEKVAIDEPSQTLTHPDTLQLAAVVTASGGAATTVTWSSGTVGTATVSAGGLVTTVAAGTTVITATSTYDATITDDITITVV
jgi:uncharacterized protein YjdB